ncbi:MAG: hypothetical protein ABSB00_01825 [Minisyncoccia bacterium]|jgi:membrane protein DedA with SNARE-associated domain
MFPFFFLSHLLGGVINNTAILSLTIILGVFIFEDPTTVIVGVLAADGIISIPVALLSLYTGIIVGDFGLYFLGWLASIHPRLGRYVDHDLVAPFRVWLESRFVLTVFSARFVPGLRLPTFTACGFFRLPFLSFVLTIITAASIWTTFLFSVSYWFGSFTSAWIGPVRWSIALIFLLVLFLIARHNLLAYRARKNRVQENCNN